MARRGPRAKGSRGASNERPEPAAPVPPNQSLTVPAVTEALARLGGGEQLREAYEAWDTLRRAQAELDAAVHAEQKRLDDESGFLLGAASSALGISGAFGLPASSLDGSSSSK